MIPKECRRLAEVDFPIAEVSKHSAREKSIRHGHPSTLHLWWARRPLAACRGMLMALLLPDPEDENCSEEFKEKARECLGRVQSTIGFDDKALRKALLKFIADFSNWDLANRREYVDASRDLVKAAHGGEAPLVVDPFAGGGSIPLEALRVGCETFASDLNPVACLILKVLLEDIPRHGPELADELRKVGTEIKAAAERELAKLYPVDADGSRPIAYLWARTVRCESPNCGAEIPLMRSFWLCKKPKRKRAIRYQIKRPAGQPPEVELEVFQPRSDKEVSEGTVTRAKARCLACGTVLSPERVRAQLVAQRGGADVIFDETGKRQGGARLLAVVSVKENTPGRHYRVGTSCDYEAVLKAQRQAEKLAHEKLPNGVKAVPDEALPPIGTLGFRVQRYGMTTWGDLFTARQKVALGLLNRLTTNSEGSLAARECVALALTRSANAGCSLCRWHVTGEKHEGVYSRQALPIVWDFSEGNPFSSSTGGYEGALDWIDDVVRQWPRSPSGQVHSADASSYPLPEESANIWFTDPPYYDAVPYADLSDFFFVWLKRALPNHPLLKDPFDPQNSLTPKQTEAVQNERSYTKDGKPKDRDFYETSMKKAFEEGRKVLREDGISSVVFAHKTTEGWEALLSGLIQGGWTITGSWPISTEMGSRLRARESAALDTSVHLVCRPRPEDAPTGDWGEVLRELPKRVQAWIDRLQGEGVRGADLVFACIGPALEIFSRYGRVETAEGREVTLAEYLEKVWEVVGRCALEQVLGNQDAKAGEGMAGAVEEDARLTALFLWTLQSTKGDAVSGGEPDVDEGHRLPAGREAEPDEDEEASSKSNGKGFSLVFDVVRRFAQPLGIDLPTWEARIIETKKGVVRLLPVRERAKALLGEDGVGAVALPSENERNPQLNLFEEAPSKATTKAGKTTKGATREREPAKGTEGSAEVGWTTLDRVHTAMLLQAGGQSKALRELLEGEQQRGDQFLRLANGLAALYPRGSEERRLLEAMLLAMPK